MKVSEYDSTKTEKKWKLCGMKQLGRACYIGELAAQKSRWTT